MTTSPIRRHPSHPRCEGQPVISHATRHMPRPSVYQWDPQFHVQQLCIPMRQKRKEKDRKMTLLISLSLGLPSPRLTRPGRPTCSMRRQLGFVSAEIQHPGVRSIFLGRLPRKSTTETSAGTSTNHACPLERMPPLFPTTRSLSLFFSFSFFFSFSSARCGAVRCGALCSVDTVVKKKDPCRETQHVWHTQKATRRTRTRASCAACSNRHPPMKGSPFLFFHVIPSYR